MENKFYYPAILQKEDVGYSIWINDIDGCVSQGDTFEEAIENIHAALGLFFEDYIETNSNIPKPTDPENIALEKDQILAIINFDWNEYQAKYGNKAIKKTLTIPSWLNSIAEAQHINFSSVLQTALKDILKIS